MDYELMDNKKFVFSILERLLERDKLDAQIITLLCDADECKRLFDFSSGFSVLREVSASCTSEELDYICYDGTKKQRYYRNVFKIQNRRFVVCNHWYGPNKSLPDNRTPFLEWAKNIF